MEDFQKKVRYYVTSGYESTGISSVLFCIFGVIFIYYLCKKFCTMNQMKRTRTRLEHIFPLLPFFNWMQS